MKKIRHTFDRMKQFFKILSDNWKTHYRLTVTAEENHDEKFSFILTPQRIVVVVVSSAVGLIALTALIISITPLKYYIPGYTTHEEHLLYKEVAHQVDSLSLMVQQNQQYIDNFYRILNEDILDDENHIENTEVSAANHNTQERSEKGREAIDKVMDEADLILANHNKNDYSKVSILHRANISSITLYSPTSGSLVREFDLSSSHYGIDIRNKRNTIITSVADGIVIFSGFDPKNGNTIIIQHPGGIISIYMHNEILLKSTGSKISMGDPIARMGCSGDDDMTYSHLHFELWYNGFPVNPLDYIAIN